MRRRLIASLDGYSIRNMVAAAALFGLGFGLFAGSGAGLVVGATTYVLGAVAWHAWSARLSTDLASQRHHSTARADAVLANTSHGIWSRTVPAAAPPPAFVVDAVSDVTSSLMPAPWSPARPRISTLPTPVDKPRRARARDVETNTPVM